MNVEEIRARCEQVPGLVDLEAELPLLHRLVSALEPGQVYFEIGTAGGRSALIAGLSAQEGVEVWTIDSAKRQSVASLVAYIDTIIRKLAWYDAMRTVRFCPLASEEMAWDEKPIDVLFIDGNHSPAAVQYDVERWGEYVPIGGIVAFHDAVVGDWPHYKGVTAAVARLLETGDWEQKQGARSIAVLRRVR
jgi:predicted O-methyltransferase YrrM